uniref:Retinoic acid induced 14 n=1 Tax=Myripristis murdjan TaxID=586833 RepID=A0A668AB99_9TELE
GEVEKVASLLAKKGASAVKLDSDGKSALHVAASRGQTDCLCVILAHGADLSVTDAAGFTALHLAAKNNHLECSKKLIQVNKCTVDAVDGSGKTALHHAAVSGNIQIVQLLCEHKSPVNLRDADGLTPLLLSARHAHAELCSALLDWGADINASDNSGRTALMLASESNSVPVVEILVRRGADLWAVDSQGHDVLYYAKLSGGSEVKTALNAALHRQQDSGEVFTHDQVAKLSDERITTPKKRKAPPPPISPPQVNACVSDRLYEDEVRGASLREEVEKLQEEKSMLLETINDLKQIVEQTAVTGTEPEAKVSSLVSALQAKITALTLEKQQLTNLLKKRPSLQGGEDLKETSRPNSMASNSSFHSTQDDFDLLPQASSSGPVEREGSDVSGSVALRQEDRVEEDESETGREGSKEEIRLLRQALESVQTKLLETRKENRSLQAQLKPGVVSERSREREEDERGRERAREEELAQMGGEGGGGGERGSDLAEKQEVQRNISALEHEVKQLKAQLAQSGSEQENAAQQIRQLEEVLRRAEEERESVKRKEQDGRTGQIEELYKEAQEEIRMLQEALRGTVPVEAAAKDFDEMKAELNEVIAGLQRRLLELSHSFSDTKSQLSAAQKQLAEARAESSAASSSSSEQQQQQVQLLKTRLEELQTLLAETEKKYSAAQQEISVLRQEAEAQAQGSVALADHTQVVSSLGNAIKELESQSEALKQQLSQKTLQLDALQNRLPVEKDMTPDDSVSRLEHDTMKEGLEGEVSHLTQLLQGALRKQDEMALEAAAAWQEARESRAEREALQELVMSREKENQTLTSRLAESQDAVSQLKQLVENHVSSEREKNKRIDDLSREVGKLRDALNSLSQLSYSSGSPSKRQQQNQQLETLQQQIKQLQCQLAGQMDEDVQKALKQILMMCKMPNQAKEAC